MNDEKRVVAAFDFDGTITTKDTLLEFIKFTKGRMPFYVGLFFNLHILFAFKLRLYPNWKAKQRIFSYFFSGMSYEEFKERGVLFANSIENFIRPKALSEIHYHQVQGNKIYVISASVYEWIYPWCKNQGINDVLCTMIEVEDGILTGNFASLNCHGAEKVVRLLKEEPDRESYILYAYGDSRGDEQLIRFSDQGWYNKFRSKTFCRSKRKST